MTAPARLPTASSPCIKLCVIDQASGICRGCFRTLSEIAAWAGMSEADRKAVMAALPERATTLSPSPPSH